MRILYNVFFFYLSEVRQKQCASLTIVDTNKILGGSFTWLPFFNVVIHTFSSRSNFRIHQTFGKTYLSVLLICAFYMDAWFWGLNSFFFNVYLFLRIFVFEGRWYLDLRDLQKKFFPPFSYILVGCPLIWKQSLIPCIYS